LGLSANPGRASNLGHDIGRSTIAGILARNGIEPAPERERKTTWKEFLKQHWDLFVAADDAAPLHPLAAAARHALAERGLEH
jgi:putative transposase